MPTVSGFARYLSDGLAQLAVGIFEVIGHDFHIGQHGHKVGVAVPTRHDMKMDMLGNSGPGNFPLVDAHVEALGIHGLMKGAQAKLRRLHDVGQGGRIQLLDTRNMLIRSNHQVAVVVGVEIEHHKAMLAAMHDKVIFVPLPGRFGAENTARFFFSVDIRHAPGRP